MSAGAVFAPPATALLSLLEPRLLFLYKHDILKRTVLPACIETFTMKTDGLSRNAGNANSAFLVSPKIVLCGDSGEIFFEIAI